MVRRDALHKNGNSRKRRKAAKLVEKYKQTKQPQAIINMQSRRRDCAAEIRLTLVICSAADTCRIKHPCFRTRNPDPPQAEILG